MVFSKSRNVENVVEDVFFTSNYSQSWLVAFFKKKKQTNKQILDMHCTSLQLPISLKKN